MVSTPETQTQTQNVKKIKVVFSRIDPYTILINDGSPFLLIVDFKPEGHAVETKEEAIENIKKGFLFKVSIYRYDYPRIEHLVTVYNDSVILQERFVINISNGQIFFCDYCLEKVIEGEERIVEYMRGIVQRLRSELNDEMDYLSRIF